MAILDFVFGVLRCVVFIYDVITFPVYSITQQSWKDRTKQNLGNVSWFHIFFKRCYPFEMDLTYILIMYTFQLSFLCRTELKLRPGRIKFLIWEFAPLPSQMRALQRVNLRLSEFAPRAGASPLLERPCKRKEKQLPIFRWSSSIVLSLLTSFIRLEELRHGFNDSIHLI